MMEICLINGSPKAAGSCSQWLVEDLVRRFPAGVESFSFHVREGGCVRGAEQKEAVERMSRVDRVIFVFPLYVDGIPSQLLEWMVAAQRQLAAGREVVVSPESGGALKRDGVGAEVFAVVNCGFFEGRQNRHALRMIEHFCHSCGFRWRYGVGIGGGPYYLESRGMGEKHPLRREAGAALDRLAEAAARSQRRGESGESLQEATGESEENCFVQMGMPRRIYWLAANVQWLGGARRNGVGIRRLLERKPWTMD